MKDRGLIPWGKKGKGDEEFPIFALQHEVNRLFDDLWRGFDLTSLPALTRTWEAVQPQIDLVENDKEIQVTAELPGLEEKDVEILLDQNTLTIKGEKKAEKEEKGKNYYRQERSFGAFQRVIALPKEVQMDKVEAVFKKGVLTITMPKTPAAQKETKKINIKSE